ncbi:hypothetical protein KXD40_004546 [Peronospora effusa]|uniref:Uncharacterized protein n=1 Tax=Peronospora effusa TaxID=542832 RepID=A0A3M6V858_9STRA|nr:hypothetical protein DD238_008042 [Peronospora effusa]RQM15017.1 hypothetical protein DD237_007512 [Peronospora effusa]UIZ28404.1 hypothetical protein KXD40_004546 [Peronospora effusa]CAI5722074.1 unnamed protein product [Peronospora effusa]
MTPPPMQRPAHSFCSTERRSCTSPHLVRTRSKNSIVNGTSDVALASEGKTVTSRLTRKTKSLSERLEPVTSECLMDIAIFLGGSCNPTTWREDIAMPMLDAAHVRYFNPQVDEWFEELIEIETKAKETAQIMLVVVDKLTRCLVSINEAVEFICRGRKVMLVVEDIGEGDKIAGKLLSKMELADLNGARQCLRDLAMKRNVGIFPDVATAIDGCITWLIQTNAPKFRPEMRRLRKRSSIVLNEWCGKHQLNCVASRSHSLRLLKFNNCDSSKSITDDNEQGSGSSGLSSLNYSLAKKLGCRSVSDSTGGSVYLGGNLSATSWRQKVAIPLLHKSGISVYVPFADYLQVGLSLAAEKHAKALAERFQKDETQKTIAELILFVIPRNSRSIAAMTEAIELVLSHQALLLVIEPVEEGCMIENEVGIIGREFKDLARARKYLREMAERNDVAVFESVTEAVKTIVERLA